MGLMDKFKNLFTDEEVIEEEDEANNLVEIREVKKDEPAKLPTFMREKIEKEEQLSPKEDEKEGGDLSINLERNQLKLKKELDAEEEQDDGKSDNFTNGSFKFPIDINDNDFIETRSRQSIHQNSSIIKEQSREETAVKSKTVSVEKKVSELYKDKKETTAKDEKKFKATPIISPIYGVLEKNYASSDIKENTSDNFEATRPSKNVDFDSVRKKAYGNLNDEIKENLMCENCEYLKEVKECHKNSLKKNNIKDNLVYEVLEDNSIQDHSENNDITLDEAAENYFDYGVAYERKQEILEELKEEDKVKIVNHEDNDLSDLNEKQVKEIPPVKSSINLLSTLKKSMGEEEEKKDDDLELTDDLFNLIDSMYDERDEKK